MSKENTYPTKTIAHLLDVTSNRVGQLAKEGVITKKENGRYPIECIPEYIRWLRLKAFGKDIKSGDAQQQRTRLLRAQADIAEKEVEFLSHELVPAEHVTKLIQGMNMAVRAKLLSMPTKIAAVILSVDTLPEAQSIIKAEINEALKELYDEIPPGAEGYLPKFSKNLAPPTESEYIGMG